MCHVSSCRYHWGHRETNGDAVEVGGLKTGLARLLKAQEESTPEIDVKSKRLGKVDKTCGARRQRERGGQAAGACSSACLPSLTPSGGPDICPDWLKLLQSYGWLITFSMVTSAEVVENSLPQSTSPALHKMLKLTFLRLDADL